MQIPIEQLLNLPDIQVLKVEITEREIRCAIESTRGYSLCHRCGLKATKFFEHGETLTLRHLPICEKEVFLFLKTKRCRCQHCDGRPTTTERGDWYDADAKCTKVFAEFLLRALVNSTISDVSIKYRVPYDRVRGVLGRYVKGEVDWDQFKHLRQLGLDEISLLKGHGNFVTIVSRRNDQEQPVVLWVLKNHKKETVVAFLKSIPERLRATVEEGCTDLYEGFLTAAEEVLPQAKVIGDRFHVAKLYRAALLEIITNYFIRRSNSGWVEGLNNKIKVLKRRCYGIANPISLFRISLDLCGYEAFAN